MPILNRYHGCEIESSDDGQLHTLHRGGKAAGVFDTLAEAIHAARRFKGFVHPEDDVVSPPDDIDDSDRPTPLISDQSHVELELPATD